MENTFKQNFLDGKVVVITGTTGILYGIALALLKFGAQVIIMSRKIKNVNASVESLKKESNTDKIWGCVCDVRKVDVIQNAIDQVLSKFNKIDVLINGAAGNFLSTLDGLSYNAFKTVMEIDAHGTFNVTKIVYEKCFKLRKNPQQQEVNIINISATLHYQGVYMQTHAGAAKAAVDAMTKHLAVELGPQNIRVNGIAPGPIQDTEGFSKLRDPSDDEQKFANHIPLQKMGTRADIASAVLFIVSDAAKYLTGHILVVDGGQCLSVPNFTLGSPALFNKWIGKPKL